MKNQKRFEMYLDCDGNGMECCEHCKHYYRHYVYYAGGYHGTSFGHCGHPRLKFRYKWDGCNHYDEGDGKQDEE